MTNRKASRVLILGGDPRPRHTSAPLSSHDKPMRSAQIPRPSSTMRRLFRHGVPAMPPVPGISGLSPTALADARTPIVIKCLPNVTGACRQLFYGGCSSVGRAPGCGPGGSWVQAPSFAPHFGLRKTRKGRNLLKIKGSGLSRCLVTALPQIKLHQSDVTGSTPKKDKPVFRTFSDILTPLSIPPRQHEVLARNHNHMLIREPKVSRAICGNAIES